MLDPLFYPLGLLSRTAVHNYIIGIAFKMNARIIVLHPLVEGQMQKEIGQQGADYSALWGAAISALLCAVFELHINPKPSLNVEQYPFAVRKPSDSPHDQAMIQTIEELLDI
jgi:hypothetical protein